MSAKKYELQPRPEAARDDRDIMSQVIQVFVRSNLDQHECSCHRSA